MLGGVLCALAARALARRGGASTGWTAFWAVGLLTPVSLYAVSFWEHTLGLAAMLWAIVWFVDVVRAGTRGLARRRLVGGALFGAAAVLRTEALVYFAVTLLVVLGVLVVRDRAWARAIAVGAAAAAGLVAVLLANVALEILTIGASVRTGRTAGAAGAAGGATLWDRIDQATTTATGSTGSRPRSTGSWARASSCCWPSGAWVLARPGGSRLARSARPWSARARSTWCGSRTGSSTCPGFLTASPLAAVGLVLVWKRRDAVAPGRGSPVLALPLVWVTPTPTRCGRSGAAATR